MQDVPDYRNKAALTEADRLVAERLPGEAQWSPVRWAASLLFVGGLGLAALQPAGPSFMTPANAAEAYAEVEIERLHERPD